MKNKKGQLDHPIVWFFIIVFGLVLMAPILLKVFNSIQTPVSSALGNITGGSGEIAQTNFNAVMTPLSTMWDKVIIFAFVIALMLLFISAFLIDTSPFWIILYIFVNFMLILFAPAIMDTLGGIYDSANFATESAQLVFIGALRTYFAEFLVGIMFLTGVIIYGKIWLFGSNSGGGRR